MNEDDTSRSSRVSVETRNEERLESERRAGPDREPSAEEERDAEAAKRELGDELEDVARHEEEMTRRGAEQKGEGAIP